MVGVIFSFPQEYDIVLQLQPCQAQAAQQDPTLPIHPRLINSSCEVLKQNQLFKVSTVFPANISIPTIDFFLNGAVNTVVVNRVAFPIKVTLAQRAGVKFP